MIKINPTYKQVAYIMDKYDLKRSGTRGSESYVNIYKQYYYTCTRINSGVITHINQNLADAIKQDKLISDLIK